MSAKEFLKPATLLLALWPVQHMILSLDYTKVKSLVHMFWGIAFIEILPFHRTSRDILLMNLQQRAISSPKQSHQILQTHQGGPPATIKSAILLIARVGYYVPTGCDKYLGSFPLVLTEDSCDFIG